MRCHGDEACTRTQRRRRREVRRATHARGTADYEYVAVTSLVRRASTRGQCGLHD